MSRKNPSLNVSRRDICVNRMYIGFPPSEIGESCVSGGLLEERTGGNVSKKAGDGAKYRIERGSTCDCVCDSLFALTSRWILLHQLRGSSTTSSLLRLLCSLASPAPAPPLNRSRVLRSSVCSWHTTCVFACVSDLRWIGTGTARTGLGSRSPSTFRTLLDRAQGTRERCRRRRWMSSTRIGQKV